MNELQVKIHTQLHDDLPGFALHNGGLWVDYNLMSTIPGLHVLGEANFSDHGANRSVQVL
jgi:succinate dehydrogenase/fumarate reductase flavoprotein subunit